MSDSANKYGRDDAAADLRYLDDYLRTLDERARAILRARDEDPEKVLEGMTFRRASNVYGIGYTYVGDPRPDSLDQFGVPRFAVELIGFVRCAREFFAEFKFAGLVTNPPDPQEVQRLLQAFNFGRAIKTAQIGCGLPEVYAFEGRKGATTRWATAIRKDAQKFAIESAEQWWKKEPDYKIGLLSEHIANEIKTKLGVALKPDTIKGWLKKAEKAGALSIPAAACKGGPPRK